MAVGINYLDRLSELKIAILETQLHELYEHVSVETEKGPPGQPTVVNIVFQDESEGLHYLLTRRAFLFMC